MSRLPILAAVVATLLSTQAARAVEVTQTVTTSAPPAKVMALIGRFDNIAAWLPGVESSPADKGNDAGSVRVITLKAPGSPTVTERLTTSTPTGYSYTISKVDPKVLPVSEYSSTLNVAPDGTGSAVTWQGTFKPAGGADDATAQKAITGLYRAGLDNIKALAEKQ